ncbi:MAG: macro domain-containing protein [Candidatus Electryonea clarkiae]|nr:macro domain-containing protein [Candidatus Electryonea clarkiae]MDP8285588.1 macro domain-containing protein [Candidatus Electryonea clarkiae]
MNKVIETLTRSCGTRLVLVLGDITEESVDAIVNAANTNLLHGGGVAGAIVRKGGDSIQEESNRVAPVVVGNAAITGAGKLLAKYVIHAVGPRWGEGDEDSKLAGAVRSSILLANDKELKSISMPAISTGIFGFPLKRAVGIILGSIDSTLGELADSSLKEIRICIFDRETLDVFVEGLEEYSK